MGGTWPHEIINYINCMRKHNYVIRTYMQYVTEPAKPVLSARKI